MSLRYPTPRGFLTIAEVMMLPEAEYRHLRHQGPFLYRSRAAVEIRVQVLPGVMIDRSGMNENWLEKKQRVVALCPDPRGTVQRVGLRP